MTDRTLNVVLKFTVDKAASDRIKAQARDTAAEQEKAAKKASDTAEREANRAAKAVEKAAKDAAKAQEKAAKDAGKAQDELTKKYEETKKRLNELREFADRLGSVSATIAGVGALISGPIILAARSYVQNAGDAEAVSGRWLNATKRISEAQNDVGRVAATAIIPYLEMAASLAEKAAKFVEANPEVINAALKIGTAVTTVGALGALVSRGIRLYADVKAIAAASEQLLAGKLMDTAANKQLTAAGLMVKGSTAEVAGDVAETAAKVGLFSVIAKSIGSVLTTIVAPIVATVTAGVAVGGAINQGLASTEFGKKAGLATTGQFATVAAYNVGSMVGGNDKGMEWAKKVATTFGYIDKETAPVVNRLQSIAPEMDKLGAAMQDVAGTTRAARRRYEDLQKEQVKADEEYSRQRSEITARYGQERANIERQYEKERAQIVRDYARERRRAEEDFARSVERQTRDFNQAEAKAEADYYAQRSEAAREFGEETRQMEADHQREMLRMRQDHEDRLEGLIASRDALGIVAEVRSYQKERKRAEEDYRLEAQQRKQEYARQMADMQASFEQQRAERLSAFEQQQADQQEDFDLQQERNQENYRNQLAALRKSHEEQLQELDRAKRDELDALRQAHIEQEREIQSAMDSQLAIIQSGSNQQQELLQGMYDLLVSNTQDMVSRVEDILREAQEYVEDASGEGRAAGGYVGFGMYRMGEAGREFVLNNSTTQAAERVIQGSLNQQNVLAGLVSGASGGAAGGNKTVSLHQNFSFGGDVGEHTINLVRKIAYGEAARALNEYAEAL